ncbi:MAG: BatA domain-containing protein [Planctomycetaceae bacterium]
MIFVNWLLALGALAFTVPLAIHLLFRNRFEVIDWGAMRFLESVVRVNRRRMQLRNLLLLLIRCAIPILLAFCLARPVLTGWQTLPGDQPVSLLLAIDTSYSLAAQVDPSARRFDRILATAQDVVSTLPRGSDVMLVTSAGSGAADPSGEAGFRGDPQSMLSALQSLRLGGAPLSIESLLSESLRKISAATTERRQIVLLTDDVASDFTQAQLDAYQSIGQRRAALTPAPAIAWIDAWQTSNSSSNNRRISRLEPAQSASVPGQAITWTVEARSDADTAATATLDVRVDGTTIESPLISFRGGVARATFTTEFQTAGRHTVEVALPAEDDFASDDRLRADYVVIPPIDVWLVDGNPSDKPLQSDTDFLAIALSPFSLAGEKAVDLFRTSKKSARELVADKDQPAKIVVLADVAALRSESIRWLQTFVERDGGTLVVFAGPSTEPQWLDEHLLTSDLKPLLPMRFEGTKTVSAGQVGAKIDETRFTFPPLASFAREAKGTLGPVEVSSYLMMQPRPDQSPPNVIMRLENGDPLIAVSEVGNGRVMQVATTANDRWTSLPRRLAFVPLMQRLFMHLATGESRANTPTAGEPIVIDMKSVVDDPVVDDPAEKDTNKANESSAAEPDPWQVMTPAGESYPATVIEGRLQFENTSLAGTYRFDRENHQPVFAAVNVPEVDLKRTPAEAAVRDEAAQRIGATRYASLEAYQTDDSTKRFGRGIWRYLLIALLAAMVIEPFLQQRGARVPS